MQKYEDAEPSTLPIPVESVLGHGCVLDITRMTKQVVLFQGAWKRFSARILDDSVVLDSLPPEE